MKPGQKHLHTRADLRDFDRVTFPWEDWPWHCLRCGRQISWVTDPGRWMHHSAFGMYRSHAAVPDEESPVWNRHRKGET